MNSPLSFSLNKPCSLDTRVAICYNETNKRSMVMEHLNRVLDELTRSKLVSNIAVRVGRGEVVLSDSFRGKVDELTLFDIASVTKVMATTTLALIALDKGILSLDDRVDKFYKTEKNITIYNLLTHTIGIGYKLLTEDGVTCENIADKILSIPSDIEIGADVRYSCPAFILLGKILEFVFAKPLNIAFDELVAKPLELTDTTFLPHVSDNIVNANLDPNLIGVVNDYNANFLGGVAGNAGIFSNLKDITKYAKLLLNRGAPLFDEDIFSLAAANHTANMSASRGLGFLYVDKRYSQAYGLFEDGAIGHCGHTGQSIFVDYRTGLDAIILSDATVSTIKKYGEERYGEVMKMRSLIHNAIKLDLEELN